MGSCLSDFILIFVSMIVDNCCGEIPAPLLWHWHPYAQPLAEIWLNPPSTSYKGECTITWYSAKVGSRKVATGMRGHAIVEIQPRSPCPMARLRQAQRLDVWCGLSLDLECPSPPMFLRFFYAWAQPRGGNLGVCPPSPAQPRVKKVSPSESRNVR